MSKVIMILGAGIMQLPAYQAAKKNGWISLGADGNPQAPCRRMADHFIDVDLKDRIGLAEKALEFQEKLGLDGVFTCGTDFSSSVAWVAEKLGLPGISYQTALDCTDKYRMRTLFKEKDIPCPAFREIDEDSDPEQAVRGLSYPLVVKPVDNMGGRGVVTVTDPEELREAVKEAVKFSRTNRAIVEEYMDGPEFSLDSLIYQGRMQISGFADRHIFFPPYFIEMGHTLPTSLGLSDQQEIIRVFENAVRALGIVNGAAKGDIKLTSRGVMIGEIAARLSGGYMSGWTYPYASGIPLVEKGMRIAMGLDPGSLEQGISRTSSERAFISIPGRIRDILNLEEAHDIAGVKDIFLRVEEGDDIAFPVNNVTKCGNVIAVAESREEALNASMEAVGKIRILLEKENSETRHFLEMPLDKDYPPSAYKLDKSGIDLPEEMEDFKPDYSMQYAAHPVPRINGGALSDVQDWHGLTLPEVVVELEGEKKVTFAADCEWTLFGKHFWYSLLRGGIQGALWFLERNEE